MMYNFQLLNSLSDQVTPGVKKPLRIAHVTATFPPYRGGTGNVCYNNARELIRLGHCVKVFTTANADAPPYETIDGFEVVRLKPLIRVGNAAMLPGLLSKLDKLDLIHLHYPFFGGELSALATRLHKIPFVITYHQDVLLTGLSGLIANVLQQTVGKRVLRSANKLLFTTTDYGENSNVRPFVADRSQLIGELANGVDTNEFYPGPQPTALLEKHALSPDDQVILLVAALDQPHYFKGVTVLLEALTSLPVRVKAVIVGEGSLRESYENRAAQLGVLNRVRFVGRVSDGELPYYYRLAHITVLPSTTMGEAFGLVLVEALACGCPVIVSDLPGVRTVIDAGKDGLLAQAGNPQALSAAISDLLSDESRRQIMGQHGRARTLSNYDWKIIGTRLQTIYYQVLAQSKQSLPSSHSNIGES